MKSTTAALLAFNLMTLGVTHAFAANIADVAKDRAEAKYDATKSNAKQQYEAAKANCRNMAGNSRDVCMKEAKKPDCKQYCNEHGITQIAFET